MQPTSGHPSSNTKLLEEQWLEADSRMRCMERMPRDTSSEFARAYVAATAAAQILYEQLEIARCERHDLHHAESAGDGLAGQQADPADKARPTGETAQVDGGGPEVDQIAHTQHEAGPQLRGQINS